MSRTRIVQMLRVLLPLAALVLLSTLFLFSGNREDGESLLPYAEVTPETLAERPSVINPTYAGVARDGTEISMSADSANPATGTRGGSLTSADGASTIDNVSMMLRDTAGVVTDLVAGSGELADGRVHLREGVKVTTSAGWAMTSSALEAELATGTLSTKEQVDVLAPFGTLTAQEMELRSLPDGSGQRVLDLKGGVRMIYRP